MLDKHLEQLNNIIETCIIHKKRLDYAYSKIHLIFPLTEELYYTLRDDDMSYIDQYIFRFAKYQDLIGGKLFKQILLIEGEDVDNMSFKDIFNKSEKIGIAENWEKWFELRQMRNEISHEYPVISEEGLNSLNQIILNLGYLRDTYFKCINCLNSKKEQYRGTP